MKTALDAAKISSLEANRLRKAMANFRSRGMVEELQDMMVGRMIARGYDPDFAECCFNQIKGFGEYGFPESHAASFAHLVYVSSWLKCHYPAAFAYALLNSQPMGFYAPAQIDRDAREHKVAVRGVDVNHSLWDNTLEGNGGVRRLGLRQITGLNEAAAARLIAAAQERDEGIIDSIHFDSVECSGMTRCNGGYDNGFERSRVGVEPSNQRNDDPATAQCKLL